MQSALEQLKGDTGRLAATYLAIIMALTIVFSSIIYGISSSQFDRPFSSRPQNGGIMQFDEYTRGSLQNLLDERARQARAELLLSLIFLDLTVLLAGAIISYVLARKTLEPIEAAMQSQTRFVSDASHELRTPLTALQVTNEVALRKKKLTLAQAKELLGYNLAETIKLRTLSESLLGLARQDTADEPSTNVDAHSLVTSVVASLKVLADQKRVKLVVDVPQTSIVVSAATVTQVLGAFIDNAIKYGPASSTVTISFVSTNNEQQFSVHDDGPGIPLKHQSKVFERFYRVDESRSSQNIEGSGLGLSIAKTAAERQGYSVSLKAGKQQGNTFILHIPFP